MRCRRPKEEGHRWPGKPGALCTTPSEVETSMVTDHPKTAKLDVAVDAREALFNCGAVGPVEQIQDSTKLIVSIRGILYDLDPDILTAGAILKAVPKDPAEFYAAVIRPMLDRHPVLAKAEVRSSGRGLHAILRFDEPVEVNSEGERDRWAGVVEVVQAALPIDPDQPGITATTRPIGSINGKNGAMVTMLAKGEPVTADEVRELFDEMIEAPFRAVMKILTGKTCHRAVPFLRQGRHEVVGA